MKPKGFQWIGVQREMEEVLKKLRYKPGQAAVVLEPPEGMLLGIEAGANAAGRYDFVLLFVNNAKEVEQRLPQTIPSLNEDALFWIAYPKMSSKVKTDINRDSLFKLVQAISDYVPVSNVALDDKWSVLRLRHKQKVGK